MLPVNSNLPATDRNEKKSSNRSGTLACSFTVVSKSKDLSMSARTNSVNAKNKNKRNNPALIRVRFCFVKKDFFATINITRKFESAQRPIFMQCS